MGQAFENSLIAKNPTEGCKLPPRQQSEKRVFTPEEQAAFITVAKDDPYGQVCIFILCTGLRIGECLALEWEDVDFEAKTVKISKTLTVTKDPYDSATEHWGVGPVKTKSGNRIIPLIPSAIALLENIKASSEHLHSSRIFCDLLGNPLGKGGMRNHLIKFLKQIGIETSEGFTLHSLRHTFATRGLESGVELRIMQEILGHANMSMTSDLYTHILPDKKKSSVMKMEDTISF